MDTSLYFHIHFQMGCSIFNHPFWVAPFMETIYFHGISISVPHSFQSPFAQDTSGKKGMNQLPGLGISTHLPWGKYRKRTRKMSGMSTQFSFMGFNAHRIHGAGIFTYIYPKNGPVLQVNIPYMDPMGWDCNYGFIMFSILQPLGPFVSRWNCTTVKQVVFRYVSQFYLNDSANVNPG